MTGGPGRGGPGPAAGAVGGPSGAGVDAAAVLDARLVALGLRSPTAGGVGEVVDALVAVQAQEFQPALWGLSRRVRPDARPSAQEARAAFDDGEFLRTHVLRPTWHVVRPDDARWLLALTGPRVTQANRHPVKQFGVDERFDGSTDVLAAAVADGPRTRAELAEELAARGMASTGPQLGYLVMRAELDRVLISGPMRGRQHTYAAFDDRVPAGYGPVGAAFDADAAVVELLRRYLATRAYATVQDVSRWSGLTLTQVRHGLDLLGSEAEQVPGAGELEGLALWRSAGRGTGESGSGAEAGDRVGPAGLDGDGPVVDLLHAYDELFMSYSESRRAAVEPGVDMGERPGGSIHAIAVDGRGVGRWTWTVGPKDVKVSAQWHREPTPAERSAYDAAVGEIGAYWGLPVREARPE